MSNVLSDKKFSKWVRYWRLSFGKDEETAVTSRTKTKEMVISDSMSDGEYQIATCCSPIPGDDVVGYMDNNNVLTLHSRKCPVAIRLMSSQGNRIVSAKWESHKILSFLVVIEITGIDQMGIVSKITKVISDDQSVNMRAVHFESHDGIFEGEIHLYIYDSEDLNNLVYNISLIKGVHSVTRKEKIKTTS